MRCDECSKEIGTKEGGELRRPVFRNRDGVNTEASSLVVFTPTNNLQRATAGISDGDAITIPDNIIIGQLPGASIKAHINIRDVFASISSDGTITSVIGFLYYKDVWQRLHCVAGFSALGSINNFALSLIAGSPITDAMPTNLGNFSLEIVSITLGTGTFVRATIRANIEVLYEQ